MLDSGAAMTWTLYLVAALAALYAMHRAALHLESRGYLYYLHKKPEPGGHSAFLPIEELIAPQVRHVIEAENLRPAKMGDERTGKEDREPKP
jgi:hypothetical protein